MSMTAEQKIFMTADLDLAVWLSVATGRDPRLAPSPDYPGKTSFLFEEDDEVAKARRAYFDGSAAVNPRVFMAAFRATRRRVDEHNGRREERGRR